MVKKQLKNCTENLESTDCLSFKYLGNKKVTIRIFLLLSPPIDLWNIKPKILGCLEAAWLSYIQIPCSTKIQNGTL